MDLVEVEEKHTPNPGVHRGNNKSFNNNDHKLLNAAERWQDFPREFAERPAFEKWGGRVCVMVLMEQRDDYFFY